MHYPTKTIASLLCVVSPLLFLSTVDALELEFERNIVAGFVGDLQATKAGDIDGDGDVDVIGAGSNGIHWWENPSLVQPGEAIRHPVLDRQRANIDRVFLSDLDRDSDLDILAASLSGDTVEWFENQGGGDFSSAVAIPVVAGDIISIVLSDIGGDGADELILSIWNADDDRCVITWHLNNGAGAFGPPTIVAIEPERRFAMGVADLNGDGKG